MQPTSLSSNSISFLTQNYHPLVLEETPYQNLLESSIFILVNKERDALNSAYICDNLLVDEEHALNAQFIDTLNDATIILVPEHPSIGAIKNIAENVHTYLFKNKKSVLGWDVGSMSEAFGLKNSELNTFENLRAELCKKANSTGCSIKTLLKENREDKGLYQLFDNCIRQLDILDDLSNESDEFDQVQLERQKSLIETLRSFKKQLCCVFVPPFILSNLLEDPEFFYSLKDRNPVILLPKNLY